MNELQLFGLDLPSRISNNIEDIIDCSDAYMKRMRVKFKNGFQLSIVQGLYSYGYDEGKFELAILDENNNLVPIYMGEYNIEDTIIGACDISEMQYYLDLVGTNTTGTFNIRSLPSPN